MADVRIGTDIGGTFTDVAAFDEESGRLLLGKSLTTPARLAEGINAGVAKAGTAYDKAGLFLHGSTIAINTLLERTGAKTALLTTKGFRDIYEIGRVNRPDSYNLFFKKHEPLIERALRFEVNERIIADGSVRTPLSEDEIAALGRRLEALGMEAVAILFLHSYRNPAHEALAKAILRRNHPQLFVSASHELSQEYREFERCSTVAANAYIGPRVGRYLADIETHLRAEGCRGSFLVVQSTGGLYEAEQAQAHCVRMMESGPAAGVIGTRALCHAIGLENAIAFDMGGTTAKAGVIHKGEALTTGAALLGGYNTALPIQIAMMDIFEVGTGGGSIARIEDGMLRVGPQSAGAAPGPACYGLGGTQPTVTDANLMLGRLGADRFLGGEMALDLAAAERALKEHVAGPLHATAIARELGIRRVIIPRAPGVFSAFGMLFSDLRYDYVRSWFQRLESASFDEVERIYDELERQGRAAIAGTSVKPQEVAIARAADMRYVGQEHAVTVDLPMPLFAAQDREGIKRAFDEMHLLRYGTNAPKERAEIVSLRSTVTGVMRKPPQEKIAAGAAEPPRAAFTGTRPVFFAETNGFVDTPSYARAALLAGNAIAGPALIEEHASTTVVLPGDALAVDPFGNLAIAVGAPKKAE